MATILPGAQVKDPFLESSLIDFFPLTLHIPGLQILWALFSKEIQNPVTGQDPTICHPALTPAKPAFLLGHSCILSISALTLAFLLLVSHVWPWSCLRGEGAVEEEDPSYLARETICRSFPAEFPSPAHPQTSHRPEGRIAGLTWPDRDHT